MNSVQAAIFSGSAMILLALALRLFLKKHLPRGIRIAAASVARRSGVCARYGCCFQSRFQRI